MHVSKRWHGTWMYKFSVFFVIDVSYLDLYFTSFGFSFNRQFLSRVCSLHGVLRWENSVSSYFFEMSSCGIWRFWETKGLFGIWIRRKWGEYNVHCIETVKSHNLGSVCFALCWIPREPWQNALQWRMMEVCNSLQIFLDEKILRVRNVNDLI